MKQLEQDQLELGDRAAYAWEAANNPASITFRYSTQFRAATGSPFHRHDSLPHLHSHTLLESGAVRHV